MTGFDRISLASFLLVTLVMGQQARAADFEKRIPDEYETVGGFGTGLNNAGVAATDPHAAIRTNPALLAAQRGYSFSAGYHWPVAGREYYQASIVDAKTASTAAGVSYTGFQDDYCYPDADCGLNGKALEEAEADSPLIRRGVLGVGQVFGKVAVGVGGTYVEANPVKSSQQEVQDSRVRGFGLNFGVASSLTEQIQMGASIENASNRKIQDYVPKTYRAGLAYGISPNWTAALDYRQRDRVLEFEGDVSTFDSGPDLMDRPEQMVFAGLVAQLEESFRLMASYGQAVGETDQRRSLSGGAALTSKNFSLSYTMSRPYMNQTSIAHQAISLSAEMSM